MSFWAPKIETLLEIPQIVVLFSPFPLALLIAVYCLLNVFIQDWQGDKNSKPL